MEKKNINKTSKPVRSLTDEAIEEIYGDQKAEENKKVTTSVIISQKLRNLCSEVTKEEGLTYNGYVQSLIKADLRKRGLL